VSYSTIYKDDYMKSERSNKKGFTLVEIMVAVGIIALLAGIVIPNMIAAREKARINVCMANIRQLQGALNMAALVGNEIIANLTDDAAIEAVVYHPDYIKSMPSCTNGGVYSTDEDGMVYCSVHDPGPGPPEPDPT